MKHLFLSASIAALAMSAHAEQMTDDVGRTVDVPDEINTVIGLHDAIISVPLYELGFDVVGSHGRQDPVSGEWTVFGLEKLFDTTYQEAGIANIGGYDGTDLEVVKKLAPDLIVGYEGGEEEAAMLESIAPVFLQRSFTGDVFGLSAERAMANRFGKTAEFEALEATYMERVNDIKARLPYDPATKEYVAVVIFDQMNVMNGLSGMMQAISDLGFQQPQWVQDFEETGFMVPLSPEEIGKLDSDLVVIMPGYSDADQSEAAARAKLDGIAPGWDKFLKAEADGNILFTASNPTMAPSFASATLALDALEAHLLK